MHALVLLLFAAIPPDAPPVMPPDAPPVELAEHTGDPEHATLGCQCGETCDCVDCQCLDCPHRVDDTTERKQVVRLTLGSQPWCPHCPAAKRSAAASGVAVEIVEGKAAEELARRSGAASYPFWVAFDGDRITHVWTGASNPAGVRRMAAEAAKPVAAAESGYVIRRGGPLTQGDKGEHLPQPGDKTMIPEYLDRPGVIDGRTQPALTVEPVRVMQDAQRHDAAKPVQAPIRYERGIALAPGETLVAIDGVPVSQAERQEAYTQPVPAQAHHEVPAGFHAHRCRNCGHSWTHHDSNAGKAAPHRCSNCGAYEYTKSAVGGVAHRSGGGCPGGVCPPRSRGLFGGLFR